jgi:8-oxo-dGTP pyrophosphatase MutT (NUDIX family)
MNLLDSLRNNLADRPARSIDPGERPQSSVAILLRDGVKGPEVLLIERAVNEKDFWSGHIGLPGGRIEAKDSDAKQAAEREAMEELGLDLSSAEYVGQLRDIVPGGLSIVVSCFVYFTKTTPLLHPNITEVADAFWFPLDDADDPERSANVKYTRHGRTKHFPAIKVHNDKVQPVWGITYRLLKNLRQIAGDNQHEQRKGNA